MGGASAPTLLCPVAAIRAESVGAEAPPTRAARLKTAGPWTVRRSRRLPEAIVRIRKYQPRTAATDEDGRRRPR
ncbi:DUF6053 domain-containing protein [Lysobacter yananisis]|uniref:DUF6053 domain-containing protein n=1 Tax=Lysobacter yananisis TaxID=1003114 RepID=UPI003CE4917A